MSHAGHKIVRCFRCKAVVTQCRCASADKRTTYVDGCSQCPPAVSTTRWSVVRADGRQFGIACDGKVMVRIDNADVRDFNAAKELADRIANLLNS